MYVLQRDVEAAGNKLVESEQARKRAEQALERVEAQLQKQADEGASTTEVLPVQEDLLCLRPCQRSPEGQQKLEAVPTRFTPKPALFVLVWLAQSCVVPPCS